MKKVLIIFMVIALIGIGLGGYFLLQKIRGGEQKPMVYSGDKFKLPEPRYKSDISIEQALLKRRSIREYKDAPLTIAEISQLLWSAQGITEPRWGLRTAPSAGATYPLELYVAVGLVEGLSPGVYKYIPQEHQLIKIIEGDKREELCNAALDQPYVREAPMVIIFSAIYERTTWRYGERGIRYVYMEVGHASQNVYLQAVSLNLGTVVIGAFDDEEVKKLLRFSAEEHPLYLMPIGRLDK